MYISGEFHKERRNEIKEIVHKEMKSGQNSILHSVAKKGYSLI
jgi:hypothetical protein